MLTLEELIESINSRKSVSAFGISTARAYVAAMEPCLSGGGDLCPVKLFKLASADLWANELAEAANRLTYCDKRMADPDFLSKSARDGSDITKGAILEYDCILSSCTKDRDGDVVRQRGGLDVDLKMPLLWQHIQVSPIGKHVALLEQDDSITKSRFAIADTDLGRDAATLVKFGALRKSIGFKPYEFAPIEIVKGADGKDHAKGWDIKRAGCMEGSLVSIPANPTADVLEYYEKEFDGLATAHSRGLLKHAMVKYWAKGVYDARPVQVRGVDLATKGTVAETKATFKLGDATIELSTKGGGTGGKKPCASCSKMHGGDSQFCDDCNNGVKSTAMHGQASTPAKDGPLCPECKLGKLDSTGSCQNCGHVTAKPGKAAEPAATKALDLATKLYGNEYIDGSFEKVQSSLRRTASDYLRGKGIDAAGSHNYAELLATFDGSAVVCLYSYGAVKSPCYRISYTKDADGIATWTGEPAEVEVKQAIIEKAIRTVPVMARELTAKAIQNPDAAGTLKALEDVSGFAQILRQQREDRDLKEFVGLN